MKIGQRAIPHDHHLTIDNAVAIDGDTLHALVHVGLDVYTKTKLRLKGFFAPEHCGRTPDQAHHAMLRLESALQLRTLTFPLRGAKKDKYGRWTITLFIDGIAANPAEILGPYLLTEEQHRLDLLAAQRNVRRKEVAL